MNKYHIFITEAAENDLTTIGRYITEELLEPNIARNLLDKMSAEIINLQDMPYRNALVNDERLAKEGVRKILVENYIIFYVVTEQEKVVTIIRILYSRRDWINIL